MRRNCGKKLLAVASGGGHWIQLLRLRPAFSNCDVTYITTQFASGCDGDIRNRIYYVIDANLSQKFRLLIMSIQVAWFILRVRPDVIVSTGAAPGFAAVFFGRLVRAKTIWIDSIANSDELSASGKRAGQFCSKWVTQWEHISSDAGPEYWGRVF